jgi:hypothetical protein
MIDKNVIDSAIDKKYTEFSDAIKVELKNKMNGHDTAKEYSSAYDKIQQMKNVFAKISNPDQE